MPAASVLARVIVLAVVRVIVLAVVRVLAVIVFVLMVIVVAVRFTVVIVCGGGCMFVAAVIAVIMSTMANF